MFVAMGGPTGPAGANGADGATGAKGDKGDKGDTGPLNFVDRGDVTAYDFVTANFTKDATWRDLDLSAICPAGTKLVLLRVEIIVTTVAKYIKFRTKGNVNDINVSWVYNAVANQVFAMDILVVPDVNRFIQYNAMAATWSALNVVVAGYFTG